MTDSDIITINNISKNYLKFARAKRKQLYPLKLLPNRIIEDTFFAVYNNGGAKECIDWFRIEYDLPHMGPHWYTDKSPKDVLIGRRKEWHEIGAPSYILEEFEDFDDGVLMCSDGGMMDEINENLKNSATIEDRVRYIISLLQPFKNFADAFYPYERIDERKRAIEQEKKWKEDYEKMSDDLIDDNTGKRIDPQSQIEAINKSIIKYQKDIEYWRYVGDRFYWFAQHGLTGNFQDEENQEMCRCLGHWWYLMITFSRCLAALALTYGIKLMDVQKKCEIYLNWHFNITDYEDNKYITSIEHARKLLSDIEQKGQEKGSGQKDSKESIFAAGHVGDAWIHLSQLVRSANERIILIDNYANEETLMLLEKRTSGVKATIYTKFSDQFKFDLKKHNQQYEHVDYEQCLRRVHDRYLIIDDKVYHLGASVKDMGKGLCTTTEMSCSPDDVLNKLK